MEVAKRGERMKFIMEYNQGIFRTKDREYVVWTTDGWREVRE